jgi:hypothetical protein
MGWISILALFYLISRHNQSLMKKTTVTVILFLCLLLAGTQHSTAQTKSSNYSPMQVGSVLVNLGVGVGANYRNSYGTGFGFKAAAEFGLWEAGPGVITLGPEIGGSFTTGYNGYNSYDNYKSNTFVMAGRAAWHYGWGVPKLDTYGGFSAGIGFNHYSYNDGNDYSHSDAFPFFGVFAGGSYFMTPTFGFNAEFGYDITNFQVGVVFKIQ